MKKSLPTLIFIAIATSLMACRCLPPQSITDSIFDGYDLVVKATVFQVEESEEDRIIHLLVEENYKGAENDTLVVSTPRHSATCGIDAEAGQQFLMWASMYQGQFHTNSCTRTAVLNYESGYVPEHARADLKYLKHTKQP